MVLHEDSRTIEWTKPSDTFLERQTADRLASL